MGAAQTMTYVEVGRDISLHPGQYLCVTPSPVVPMCVEECKSGGPPFIFGIGRVSTGVYYENICRRRLSGFGGEISLLEHSFC